MKQIPNIEDLYTKIDDYYRNNFDESQSRKKMFITELLHQQLQKAREEERERIASELDELMEQLADIEHDRWSKWQKYLHSKVIPSADDGISLIGTEFIDRWNRQIATPYSELSEAEKESDRQQVRPYLELIKRKIRNHSELDQDKV